MMATWNTHWAFSTILYDHKFVGLVLYGVFGKTKLIEDKELPNKEMRFIKGQLNFDFLFCFIYNFPKKSLFSFHTDIFIARVKQDPNRCIKFAEYVQRTRAELKKKATT